MLRTPKVLIAAEMSPGKDMCCRAFQDSLTGVDWHLWMLVFAVCKPRIQREQGISSHYSAVVCLGACHSLHPVLLSSSFSVPGFGAVADIHIWKALEI